MWQQALRVGLVLTGLSLAGGEAKAQFFGGIGLPTFGFGTPTYGFGPSANFGMSGYFPGYGLGYGNPYYFGGYYSSMYTVPGWAASGDRGGDGWYVAESRAVRFPAVALPVSSPLLQIDTLPAGARAAVVVSVPTAQAQVWVEGKFTQQQGLVRRFATPELKIGKEYEYEIIAQWTDGQGKLQNARKTITIHAGDEVQVAFTR